MFGNRDQLFRDSIQSAQNTKTLESTGGFDKAEDERIQVTQERRSHEMRRIYEEKLYLFLLSLLHQGFKGFCFEAFVLGCPLGLEFSSPCGA